MPANRTVLAFGAAEDLFSIFLELLQGMKNLSRMRSDMGKGLRTCVEGAALRVPGLSALNLAEFSVLDDGGRVEEWIPTKVWLGMMDALVPPRIDYCPCMLYKYLLHAIIFYRGELAVR